MVSKIECRWLRERETLFWGRRTCAVPLPRSVMAIGSAQNESREMGMRDGVDRRERIREYRGSYLVVSRSQHLHRKERNDEIERDEWKRGRRK